MCADEKRRKKEVEKAFSSRQPACSERKRGRGRREGGTGSEDSVWGVFLGFFQNLSLSPLPTNAKNKNKWIMPAPRCKIGIQGKVREWHTFLSMPEVSPCPVPNGMEMMDEMD